MTRRGDFKDLVGQKFGRLTVVCFHHAEERQQSRQRVSIRFWFCKCECGGEKVVSASGLLKKAGTRSCGCSRREWRKTPAGRAVLFKKDSAFRHLLLMYKTDAKRRGHSWELNDEQFRAITSSSCHYTGALPSKEMRAKSGEVYLYNGVDRLDSNVGYVFSNCVPCCTDINLMKRDHTKEKFIELCKKVAERFSNEFTDY